ncbi:MAG TPA: hypothetical protein PLD59_08900 [Tepidisphaeraceae bacterium]|nr:hypothetical protein [Tepidisphaeraceae bacterium]
MQENNKRQLIEQIRQHNTTAEEQYLMQFDEASLQQYLDRLIGAPVARNQVKKSRRLPQPAPQTRQGDALRKAS